MLLLEERGRGCLSKNHPPIYYQTLGTTNMNLLSFRIHVKIFLKDKQCYMSQSNFLVSEIAKFGHIVQSVN